MFSFMRYGLLYQDREVQDKAGSGRRAAVDLFLSS